MSVETQCLTPRGAGGVAVVVLRGTGAEQALRGLGVAGPLLPGVVRLVRLRRPAGEGDGELLDEGLLCVRGDGEYELHVHGSEGLVEELLGLCGSGERGLDAAAPRSLEDQARDLLPGAPSEAGARMLLDQVGGALRAGLEGLVAQPDPGAAQVLVERGRRAGFLLRRTQVVLVGPANAGKSTLFNALVGQERVLASAQPGTTRDAVHEEAWLGPWPVALVDTAGERDAQGDRVEVAGQAAARRLRAGADWVLRLGAHGEPGPVPDLWTHGGRAGTLPGAAEGAQTIETVGDPAGARRRVQRLFETRFRLPAAPWRSGEAVPFLAALSEDLRGFAAGELNPGELRRRLGLWLAPGA